MKDFEEVYIEREAEYFKNLPQWPTFDIYDKNIDGLIPSTRIESWESFHEIVKSYRSDDDGTEYVFRGQHNYEWPLQPSLDRLSEGAIQEEIARKQLRNFRLSIRGRVSNHGGLNEDNIELWAIGQHHGLATPLLDWTLAPYVALFFAFVNEDLPSWKDSEGNNTNHSRAVYILNRSFIEDLVDDEKLEPLEQGYPQVVEPAKDDHGRLVNQAGLFTMAPYGETLETSLLKGLVDSEVDIDNPAEVSKYICKIHIPNSKEFRRDCLRHLRKMNIHHASLFPDVIGASGYCNELISEAIENLKKSSKIEEIPTIKTVETTALPIQKDFVIAETNNTLKELMLSLAINERIQTEVSQNNLRAIVKLSLAFIEDKAGVDWYERDSQKSRLKNIIRRQLKKIQFPDDFVSEAAESLVLKVSELSRKQDREERLKKGELIDTSRSESINFFRTVNDGNKP
jgi:hypothetical protein